MKRLIVVAAVVGALLLAGRRAEAGGSCRGQPCPGVIQVMGYGLAAAIVGGYVGGTGYFVYRDATDATQSLDYGVSEALVNGPASTGRAGRACAVRRTRAPCE